MLSSDTKKIFSLVIAFVSDSDAINQNNVFATNCDYIKNCEGMKSMFARRKHLKLFCSFFMPKV